MTMEKYGVDVTKTQKAALASAKRRLQTLQASHEKTAAETQELTRLEAEVAELEKALADQ